MKIRQIVAIVLLVAFIIATIAIYTGFITTNNSLAMSGLFVAALCTMGTFVLKRQIKEENERQQEEILEKKQELEGSSAHKATPEFEYHVLKKPSNSSQGSRSNSKNNKRR